MKKLLIPAFIVIAACVVTVANAQNTIFLKHGRIEFEKKQNMWARIDSLISDDDGSWRELAKKTTPKFKSTFFNLYFNNGKTLYSPGREESTSSGMFFSEASVGDENVIFNNTDAGTQAAQKTAFRETFLIQDSIRQIKWKITDETRNIAGFECRRANALIMDSIYIVAFYTDAIITPGGPESFTGLPGMILGVSIPHEHVSWFATKVYTDDVTDAMLKPPVKGKKMTNASLLAFLKDNMKDWGRWASKNIQEIMY